jgi:hypothetical protein
MMLISKELLCQTTFLLEIDSRERQLFLREDQHCYGDDLKGSD